MRFLVERYANSFVASPLELKPNYVTAGQGATTEEAIEDCQAGIELLLEEYGDDIYEYKDPGERPLEVTVVEVK
jgi:predicted RNase H-like HicB family nuclease